MHPSAIIGHYPTYLILDTIMAKNNYNSINLFVDLKNIMRSIHIDDFIRSIIKMNRKSDKVDTSIFSSLIPFLSFHKEYCAKRGYDIKFYILFESGDSYYHQNINENYKLSRKINNYSKLTEDEKAEFSNILDANNKLIENALNKIPDVFVFNLHNIEADFIPHYLISRNKISIDNFVNIIYSNDHDMWQCCNNPHTFIFSKAHKRKREVLDSSRIIKKLLKVDSDIPPEAFTLLMSVIGDKGDDVEGIRGIGPKKIAKIGNRLIELLGGINNLMYNIKNDNNIIYEDRILDEDNDIYKILDSEREYKTITKNMKQVDFEIMSYYMGMEESEALRKNKEKIDDVLLNHTCTTMNALYKALVKNRVFFHKDNLEMIFWQKQNYSDI